MMDRETMWQRVYAQLAVDYNCAPEDFLKDGLIFTEAKETAGRRLFPWTTPRLELITMGNGVVVNASADILPAVRRQMEGKSRFEALALPFIVRVNPYFLPDVGNLPAIDGSNAFTYALLDRDEIHRLDPSPDRVCPHVLAVVARDGTEVVGAATASADCPSLWQIGVDVSPPCRWKGLAAALVSRLTREVLNRGIIPYYSTDCSNVISQRVAVRAGYLPAWSHCFRTRLELIG